MLTAEVQMLAMVEWYLLSFCVCLSVCVMARLTDCQYVLLCVYLMSRIADALTAEARMLSVVEWYLLSFHAGRQVCVCCCML